ncbi:hypothetical protein [Flavobacterium luteum]|uniref:Uncharacterized protein n=1 Tax=Flavobacterium luteum TaxID=2026654 RepID=A0A7J5AFH5_9FLAO|nr:hypothetical protein [Flavobacterium luteum]KAB1156322.1 hypothetical protein F6464_09030 [Flavobacterium luteum]
MKTVSLLLGIICLLAMLVAFIPLLGWLNWIVVPMAVVGLIISSVSNAESGKKICTIVVIVGVIRLAIGGGMF